MTFFQLLIYNVSCKSQIQLAFISLSLLHPIKVRTAQKCRFSVILRNTVGCGNGADIKHLKVNHKWSNWSALSNCPSAPKHASRTDSQSAVCHAMTAADLPSTSSCRSNSSVTRPQWHDRVRHKSRSRLTNYDPLFFKQSAAECCEVYNYTSR